LGRLISFAAICTHIWSLLLERRVVQPRLSHNCKFACNILNFLVVLAGYRSSPPLDLTLFKGLDFPFLANVFFMKLSFAKVRCLQLLWIGSFNPARMNNLQFHLHHEVLPRLHLHEA
jgi:hypothetical protein